MRRILALLLCIQTALAGDFDRFNSLFKDAMVILPDDFVLTQKVLFTTLKLTVWEIRCYRISVEDMSVSHNEKSKQQIDVLVDVSNLDITCDVEYKYEYGFLHGTGVAYVVTDNNSFSSNLVFQSQNFDEFPPSQSSTESCNANIQITQIDFHGDFLSDVVEVAEGMLKGPIEDEIEKVACQELGSLGSSVVGDMLGLSGDFLNQYTGDLGPSVNDPLHLENTLTLPDDFNGFNLRDSDTVVGKFFNQAIQQAADLLGATIPDPNSPNPSRLDLAINVLMRSNLLDENRALSVDMSKLPMDAVLFEGHDQITQTTITLNSVRLLGLDTMDRFNSLETIGDYTLQNSLNWKSLRIEIEVTVDIRPSTLEDAIIKGSTSQGTSERISIDFGADNVEVIASLLAVIDEDKLGSLKIGPLLTQDNLLPCAQSLLHKLELSGMHVDPLALKVPTLTGFVSPGLDRVFTNSVEAAFAMYTGALQKTIPNIFQTSVRDFVNEELLSSNIFSQNGSSSCPEPKDVSGFVDFRDLFLQPWIAKSKGGSGTMPYGDIAYTLKGLLDDELLGTGANGLLELNSFIRPATEAQSGTAGTLNLLSDAISIVKTKFANDYIHSFVDRFEVGLSGIRINNLDTLVPPIQLLETTTSAHELENSLNIGPVINRPLNFTTGLRFVVEGKNSPLSMAHDLELGISLTSATLKAGILATIDANRLLNFPLKDILVPECWMALIPASSVGVGLSFRDVILAFESFDVGVNVISTTSPGMSTFTELLDMVKAYRGLEILKDRISGFVAQLLDEDNIQTQIDRALADASKVCPHSPGFEPSFTSDGTTSLSFPNFTPEIVDSLFFTVSFGAEIGFMAFLEDQSLREWEATSALSAQEKVATPNTLLNLTKTDGSLGSLVELALSEASSYIGHVTKDGDLRVNELIREWLLNGDTHYKIDFDESFEIPGVKFEIQSLTFGGIDSFTSLSILEVIGPQTILNKMSMKELSLTFEMRAIDTKTRGVMQNFKISLALENVRAEVPIFVAIDEEDLSSIPLSTIMHMDNLYSCILSKVQSVEITQMNVTFDTFKKPLIEGLMSDSNEILQEFTDALLLQYGEKIQSALPLAIDHTLRPLLNGLAEVYLEGIECKPNQITESIAGFVDFRKLFLPLETARTYGAAEKSQYGDLFPWLFEIFQDLVSDIDSNTGLSAVNRGIVSGIVESYSGSPTTLIYPGDLYDGGSRIKVGGLDATIQLKASQARIENLDTLGSPIAILEPVMGEPYELNNTATLGTSTRPLRFAMRLLVSMIGDEDMQLRNEVDISLDLNSVTFVLHAMLKMLESRFYNFPLGDVLDYNCWLAMIPAPKLDSYGVRDDAGAPTAELKEIFATVASMNLNVSCVSCTSPRMSELSDLLSTNEARDDMTATANDLLAYAKELADDRYMQIQIDRLLNEAARKCPHSPNYETNFDKAEYKSLGSTSHEFSISFLLMLTALAGSIVLAFFLLAFVIKCFVRCRHRRWLKSLPAAQVRRLADDQEEEKNEAARLNASTLPMYRSSEIPLFVRCAMPLIIVGNIGFFLSGHLSLGATVNIEGELAGQQISIRNFFEFSMAKSTVDIWNAGGKELAILILIFSGIWPYTKQLITLFLWFLPPSWCSVHRRESILLWLDCLGKWSMIDIFVLVISIAAFRISIASPSVGFLPEEFYSLDLLVVPLWGLYANMIAQLISQVSSHYIIHYHRKIIKAARFRMQQEEGALKLSATSSPDGDSVIGYQTDENNIAPHQHRFGRPHRGETDKLVVKPWVNKALLFCSMCLFASIAYGSVAASFSLEILGIIGVAVESGQNFADAKTPHSVFTVVQLLLEEARFLDTAGDYIGLGTLSLLFLFTVLVVPLLQAIALLRQWYKPSTTDGKMKMSIIIEILQAWQYAEVYLIAIFVASWQLGPISEFMINSYCESLKDSLGELVYYGILKAEDAQCFSVESKIEGGSYILALGAVLLAITTSFVNKAIIQYFRDIKKNDIDREREYESDTESGVDLKESNTRIQPVPVLFTDTFRWLMMRDDRRGCSNSFVSTFGKFKMSSTGAAPAASPLVEDHISESDVESADDDSTQSSSNQQQKEVSDHFEDESGWSSVDEESTQNAAS